MTAKQWTSDNGIRPNSYYYWRRIFWKEFYEPMHLHNNIAFHEMPFPVPSQKLAPVVAAVSPGNVNATVLVRRGDIIIVTNSASAKLTTLIIRKVFAHAWGLY